MRGRLIVSVVSALFVLMGCGDNSGPLGQAEPTTTSIAPMPATATVFTPRTSPLAPVTYAVTRVVGAQLAADGDLFLTLQDGTIGVSGGCNGIGGSYQIDDGELVVSRLAQTLMACAQPLLDQDAWITELLKGRPTIEILGDTVTISNDDVTVEFTDIEVARPDLPLDGTIWRVQSTRELSGIWSPTVPASITFRDGTVFVDSGCNTASATYRVVAPAVPGVAPGTMEVDPLEFPDAACDEPAASIARTITEALNNGQVTVEVHTNRLRLIGSNAEVELQAEPD